MVGGLRPTEGAVGVTVLLWRLKAYVHRFRMATMPMRERGLSKASLLLVHFPAALALRVWRLLAQPLNGGLIQRVFNQPRFVRFQDGLVAGTLPRFYVIVMPFTLHFLLPCIALLQGRVQIVLVINGARSWERRFLTRRFPALPVFDLWTLPLSSVAHGEVITLLLQNHRGNFGIIDHDCYVFDGAIFDKLSPADDECVLSLFGEESQSVAIKFPLTFFLFFNAEVLRQLMQRYDIDARLYREIPVKAREPMAQVGLGPFVFWKHYHTFRDTLHVLLAVALAQGLKVRFLSSNDLQPAMHVGGTSTGTHHTKDLWSLYIHLRFLELLNDPVLTRRYARLTAPLRSSSDVLASASSSNNMQWKGLPAVEALMARLHQVAKAHEQTS